MTPRILIVAGSDSGGGAGVQADVKTVTMLGGHAMTAVTALTAQNTQGVQGVMPVPPDFVLAQMHACLDDIGADAVKLGMLGSAATVRAVAAALADRDVPVVFDPVMVATSGAVLADAETIAALTELVPRAAVVTPNLPELEALGGLSALTGRGATVLVKGGHADGDPVVDRLVGPDGEVARWSAPRIETPHTHGTGCTLASAIAEGLGRGLALAAAVDRARQFVRLALRGAPGLGRGHGPMGQQTVRNDALTGGLSLNHVSLPARDHAASTAFWRGVGLRQIVESPGNGYARFEAANGATLSTHVGDGAPGATVYLEVADLTAAVAALAARGLHPLDEPGPRPWGWAEARYADSAGNPLCLYAAGEFRRFPPWRIADA